MISEAVCLSFLIDFISGTSCSDFNLLSSHLSVWVSSRVSYSVRSYRPRPVPWTSFLILALYFLIMVVKRPPTARRVTWGQNSRWGHFFHQKQVFFLIPLDSYPKNNKSHLKLKVTGGQFLDLLLSIYELLGQ